MTLYENEDNQEMMSDEISKILFKNNSSIKEAIKFWRESQNKLKEDASLKGNKYEAIYLPYNSEGKVDPENVATQLKVFFAPDDWTALVYGIALVSAERENYFHNETNITKEEAEDYVGDFLCPNEAFKTGMTLEDVSFARLEDMLSDSQNDILRDPYAEPFTDFGYLLSLTKEDGTVLYKGNLEPRKWNYEFPNWWHDGKYSNKYGAYVGADDDIFEDHLPKRRF